MDKPALIVWLLGLFMHFLLTPAIFFGPYGPDKVEGRRYAPEYHGAVVLSWLGPTVLVVLHAQQAYLIEDLSFHSIWATLGLRHFVFLGEVLYAAVITFLCVFLQTTYFTISKQQALVTCIAVCRGLSVCVLRIVFARVVSDDWPNFSNWLSTFT